MSRSLAVVMAKRNLEFKPSIYWITQNLTGDLRGRAGALAPESGSGM